MRRDQLNRRTHQTSAAAKAERLSSPQVMQRGRAIRAGGPHRAFVKTAPGATTTLACRLLVDTTGKEIDVECDIYGGGFLNGAHPPFTTGDPLWVQYYDGAWRNVTTISAIDEECDT